MPGPQFDELLGWSIANPDKVLPVGSPIFDGRFVPELTKTTADEVSTVVMVPPVPVSMPTTQRIIESPLAEGSDGVVQYLQEIFDEYESEGKRADMGLIKSIEVREDYVVIDGLRIRRRNEKMNDKTRNIATVRGSTAVFLFHAARDFFWEGLPTEEEFRRIFDSMPGEQDYEKLEHLLHILEIELNEIVTSEPTTTFLWVKKSSKNGKKVGHRAIITKDIHSRPLEFKPPGDIYRFYCGIRLLVR